MRKLLLLLGLMLAGHLAQSQVTQQSAAAQLGGVAVTAPASPTTGDIVQHAAPSIGQPALEVAQPAPTGVNLHQTSQPTLPPQQPEADAAHRPKE
jgi:hypothetical protein